MTQDEKDMQVRKFLKRVGVESHNAISEAASASGGQALKVKMVLSIEGHDETGLEFTADIET